MAFYEDACSDDETARGYICWLRRHTGKAIWRPTWEAAKAARPTDGHSDDDDGTDDDDDDDDSGYDDDNDDEYDDGECN